MNAPFRLGTQTRDAFAAYLCDDDTAEIIKPVVADLGWTVEKVYKGGLRNAVQSLSITASPSILLVDLSESSDPINDINSLAEVCEPGTVVIAIGQVNDVRLFRDLMASGIQDYLLKPVFPDQVRDVLMQAQVALSTPRGHEPVDKVDQLVTAVVGARGGVGASTIATSMAWLAGHSHKRSAALLDLDVHFGTGALSLDLEAGRGLIDAIDNPTRIDGLLIERAMVRASEQLAILSAEAPLNQPLLSDGGTFFHLREEISASFPFTVVDLPRHMLVAYPHLLQDIDRFVLVTDLTLAGARDTIRLLSNAKQICPNARVILVANRVLPQPEISRRDFETSIERKVDVVVPFEPKIAVKAAKLGKTLADAARGSKLSQPLEALLTMIVQPDEADESASATPDKKAGKSLLSKLSALPRKAKA